MSASLLDLKQTIDGHEPSSKFQQKYAGATQIVNTILGLIVEKRIKMALTKAVTEGEKPVNQLIGAISDDLEVAFVNRKADNERKRVTLLAEYSTEIQKGDNADPKKLDVFKDKIIAQEDVMDTLVDANQRASLAGMAKAHSKLVFYAKNQSPSNFHSTVTAIQEFAALAKELGDAVLKLKAQSTT